MPTSAYHSQSVDQWIGNDLFSGNYLGPRDFLSQKFEDGLYIVRRRAVLLPGKNKQRSHVFLGRAIGTFLRPLGEGPEPLAQGQSPIRMWGDTRQGAGTSMPRRLRRYSSPGG